MSDQAPEIEPPSLCTWSIPNLSRQPEFVVEARAGHATVVVGANGSGKSALGLWIGRNSACPVEKIIAHRQLWLSHGGPNITADQRDQTGVNILTWDQRDESRWTDNAAQLRSSIALFDLLSLHNSRNEHLAGMFDAGLSREEIEPELLVDPLAQLNHILVDSGLPVRIQLSNSGAFDAINVVHAATYPISQLSDGERSALLLATEVLTAKEDSIIVIDEPERHLHRKISARLIESVMAERPDCHFVVLTHDLQLGSSLAGSRTTSFVAVECAWVGPSPVGWDLKLLSPDDDYPDAIREAILGGRDQVLFVEGELASLDTRILGLLFPDWSVVPHGGCDQVIRVVKGLAGASQFAWIRVRGIVDGDRRDDAQVAALRADGILAMGVNEVESLLYCDIALTHMSQLQGEHLGRQAADLLADARSRALAELRRDDVKTRLVSRVSEASARLQLSHAMAGHLESLSDGTDLQVSIPSPYLEVLKTYEQLLAAGDLDGLVRGYPIRDCGLRDAVSTGLAYRTHSHFEDAAIVQLSKSKDLIDALRAIAGSLP